LQVIETIQASRFLRFAIPMEAPCKPDEVSHLVELVFERMFPLSPG
jgi:hypothetical protein